MPQSKKPVGAALSGWATWGAVAGGGTAGAGFRWLVTETVGAGALPWNTLAVNLTGAFLLGVVVERLKTDQPLTDGRRRALIGVASGFCGSLTTFSALAVESAEFMTSDAWRTAVLYLVVTVVAGIAAVVAGQYVSTVVRR